MPRSTPSRFSAGRANRTTISPLSLADRTRPPTPAPGLVVVKALSTALKAVAGVVRSPTDGDWSAVVGGADRDITPSTLDLSTPRVASALSAPGGAVISLATAHRHGSATLTACPSVTANCWQSVTPDGVRLATT